LFAFFFVSFPEQRPEAAWVLVSRFLQGGDAADIQDSATFRMCSTNDVLSAEFAIATP
jgi:hypothetical protein